MEDEGWNRIGNLEARFVKEDEGKNSECWYKEAPQWR